jgi:hypothetical protein
VWGTQTKGRIDETGDALAVLKAVVNDCRDLRTMLTEGDRRKAEKRKASPFLDPDKVTFCWDRQKRTVQHVDKQTGQLLPDSEVLKPGYTYQVTQGSKPPPRVPKDWLGYWKLDQPAVAYYDVTGKVVQFTLLTGGFSSESGITFAGSKCPSPTVGFPLASK